MKTAYYLFKFMYYVVDSKIIEIKDKRTEHMLQYENRY